MFSPYFSPTVALLIFALFWLIPLFLLPESPWE
jgi:hypothetical protein